MSYAVKEIFKTLQGEGAHSGRAAVLCRFSGCYLWFGREADRATAICTFCDTDFVGMDGTGGGRFADPGELADAIEREWSGTLAGRYVVLTGGEPLLQVDTPLVDALHERGFEIGVETNGTQTPPPGLDWICVSPQKGAEVVRRHGNELKLVYPQAGPSRASSKASPSTTSFCSRWMSRPPTTTSPPRSLTVPATRTGAFLSSRTR
jgi:7-carboxy-7-deazaguanine synthase